MWYGDHLTFKFFKYVHILSDLILIPVILDGRLWTEKNWGFIIANTLNSETEWKSELGIINKINY